MKFKTFLIAAFLLAITSTISAQSYRTGIGGRVGFFNGITVKHFLNRNNAVEGIMSFRWDGVIITEQMIAKISNQNYKTNKSLKRSQISFI